MAKKNTISQPRKKKASPAEVKRKRLAWLLYLLLIPAAIGLILTTLLSKPKETGPRFQKEGALQFISAQTGQTISEIEIEVASHELEIRQGLMWRRTMAKEQGMLFIMPAEEEQSFWMLNTYISLDLVFVNAAMEIVRIRPDNPPQSLNSIPSERPAKYVVELNAGYCQEHGIREGDLIQFQLTEKAR